MSETFLSVVESLMMENVPTWLAVRIKLTTIADTSLDIYAIYL